MIGKVGRLLKRHSSEQRSPIYTLALMVFFWTIFDSIMTYVTPLLIEEQGFSKSMIGFIIGTSSLTGAMFDFLICKFFKSTNFRRVFLIMFAICFIYPFLLWQAKTIWFFLFVMAVWGIYYDLYGFGIFDFIGRCTKKSDHSPNFGVVQIFRALGSILAPLIVGLVIINNVDWRSFALGWLFLSIGFVFFIVLIFLTHKHYPKEDVVCAHPRRKNLLVEVHLWEKLGKLMSPVLLVTFYLFFIEAFFWTLAPLYAESVNLKEFGGLFLMADSLPGLIIGWFVGSLTKRFGKKRTAFVGLLGGSLFLSFFFCLPGPITAIIDVFFAACFMGMALPAVNAIYADYISDAPQVEGEIEGLEDFAFNIGYMIGPLCAGILADVLSMEAAFSILGLFGTILAFALLIMTPKDIVIKTKPAELQENLTKF